MDIEDINRMARAALGDVAYDEIKRLQAELRLSGRNADNLIREIEALRAEVERLREALQACLYAMSDEAGPMAYVDVEDVARAALAEKDQE